MYSSFVRKYDKDGRLRVDHKMPRRYLQFPVDIDVDESRVYLTQMSSESDHRLVGDNSGYGGDFIGEVIALDKHSFQQILNDVRIARNAKPCWRLSVENIGQIVENQKDKEGCN